MENTLLLDAIKNTKPPYINHFNLIQNGKIRHVAEPKEQIKQELKNLNEVFNKYYEDELEFYSLQDIPMAYRKDKNVKINAEKHKNQKIIHKFDFSKFYDHVKIEYIEEHLRCILYKYHENKEIYKKAIIDENTNGVIQGSPISGVLAGLALIPFYLELRKNLGKDVIITQYSDDLTISNTPYNLRELTEIIETSLKNVNLEFPINVSKSKTQSNQYRYITGVRINHKNELTCDRSDYRNYRASLFILKKQKYLSKDIINQVISSFGFISIDSYLGKLNYMKMIDDTGKILKLKKKYRTVLDQVKYINNQKTLDIPREKAIIKI